MKSKEKFGVNCEPPLGASRVPGSVLATTHRTHPAGRLRNTGGPRGSGGRLRKGGLGLGRGSPTRRAASVFSVFIFSAKRILIQFYILGFLPTVDGTYRNNLRTRHRGPPPGAQSIVIISLGFATGEESKGHEALMLRGKRMCWSF